VARVSVAWTGGPPTRHECDVCANEILANELGVWITYRFANAVARIDPATNQLVAIIPVGLQPRSLASDAQDVWVGHQSSAGLLRINPETNQVVAKAAAIEGSYDHAWIALAETSVWVARAPTNDVVRIELQSE
jgi:YVTN family beta-propeller protein